MYGLIAKLISIPGKRDELIAVLAGSTTEMPGCFSYVIAKDSVDDNGVWVTEVWDNEASHDASFSLPTVKDATVRARPLVATFEKVAVTSPVAGVEFSRGSL